VSARRIPPFQRDVVFLLVGGTWGTVTILREGPWPLMLISAATMLGPGFLRLWLSGPGTRGSPPSGPPALPGQQRSSLSGPSSAVSEGES